ncbi:MAG: N-acetylneuraminate synthase family protein [Anaerolineaceae bacterium]|nr:N-acetylneuraminate synthase family protein [Anaerolineaceae bacterium]
MVFKIGKHRVGGNNPTYFIADVGANHDGDLDRAKELIKLCAEAGADAAKFQNFRAPEIVSDYGFKNLGTQQSHQGNWEKSVFDVYSDASVPFEWTPILKEACDEAGIDYFSSPYDFDAIDMLDPYVPAYKVGSGEITWPEVLERMAKQGKPVILATGAADIGDVQRAVHTIYRHNLNLVLLQCNTNYTANQENYDHIHLRVLQTYKTMFPQAVLGLSDHTFGHAAVLGAVALGARVVEKHFTDDNSRIGPDHKFAMNPDTWADMVENTRLLERALGVADKFVAANEQETVVIQQRCLRAKRTISKGEKITREMIAVLRPATPGAIKPYDIHSVIGTSAVDDIEEGQELCWTMLVD